MKSNTKKSWVLVFCLLVTVATSSALQYGDFTYTTDGYSVAITGYTGSGDAIAIPLAIGGKPVSSIGDFAFFNCTSLTSITIPNSVTLIGNYAFYECTSLTAITVNALNAFFSSVDGVLFNKSQTMLIVYPGGKTGSYTIPDSVNTIEDWAFAVCTNLTSVTIGNGANSIGLRAFLDCTSLTAITVNALNAFFSSVDGVLFNKSQTMLIVYPGGKTGSYTIPDSVNTIGHSTFISCASLTSITIPGSVTNIESAAFFDCTSLTSITIPNSVTLIGIYAFYDCTSLTSITIPYGITSIEEATLSGCTSLSSVTIPGSVTNIGLSAFSDCTSLTEMYFKGNAPDLGLHVFRDSDQATVYYRAGTTDWAPTFSDRPTVLWNPLIQTDDGNFGMQANGFGFNIAESESGLVVVDACTNLADSIWVSVTTNSMTSNSVHFTDSDWITHPSRYYRLSMPK